MAKLGSALFGCATAALLLVAFAGSSQAASYLHVAFYSDAACNNFFYEYVGITSSPRSANQFLDLFTYPMYSPNGCPLDPVSNPYLEIFGDFNNILEHNVTMGQCTTGRTLNAQTGASYFAVCTNSEFSPFVTNTYNLNTWTNQSICETNRAAFSRRTAYGSGVCVPEGVDSSTRYTCINSTHVSVAVCSANTDCSSCTTEIRSLIGCSGGPGGIVTWSDQSCSFAPAPVAPPMAAPVAAPPVAAPVAAPVSSSTPIAAPVAAPVGAPIAAPVGSNAPVAAPKAKSPTSSATRSIASAFVVAFALVLAML